jgi:two-component system, OmpR family, response regulator
MGETSSNDRGSHGRGERQARILVVEDDPALQRMILDYFVDNNIRTPTGNGQ